MRYVISIDVGIQNMGLCITDISVTPAEVVEWEKVKLCTANYFYPSDTVAYVIGLVRRYQHYFDNLVQLIIEQQMRVNMRMVEAALQALFFNDTIVLNPRIVKLHYNLCTRNYKSNKMAAVNYVAEHMDDHKCRIYVPHDKWQVWENTDKRDDLADAMIMTLYFLETYGDTWVDTTTKITSTLPSTTRATTRMATSLNTSL